MNVSLKFAVRCELTNVVFTKMQNIFPVGNILWCVLFHLSNASPSFQIRAYINLGTQCRGRMVTLFFHTFRFYWVHTSKVSIPKRPGNLLLLKFPKRRKGRKSLSYYEYNRYTYIVHMKNCITLFQKFLRLYAKRFIHDVTWSHSRLAWN